MAITLIITQKCRQSRIGDRNYIVAKQVYIKAQLEAAYLRDLVLCHSILQYTVNHACQNQQYVLTSRYDGLGMKVGRKEKSPRPNNLRCWLHDVTMML